MKSGLKFDNLAWAVGSFLSEGLESGPPLAEVSGLITQIKQWVVTAELWSQNLFVFTSKPGVMINWQKLDQQHQSSALQSSRLHQHSHSPLYRFVYLKIFCKTVTRFLLISSHFFLSCVWQGWEGGMAEQFQFNSVLVFAPCNVNVTNYKLCTFCLPSDLVCQSNR